MTLTRQGVCVSICIMISDVRVSSAEDAAGARAHGAGGAHGARVQHHAPHVRARAVGAAARRAAGVARQRAPRARLHEERRRRADRVRRAAAEGLSTARAALAALALHERACPLVLNL